MQQTSTDLLKNITASIINNAAYVFIAILFIASLLISWPGIMRPDSITQFSEALSGNINDCSPPVMAIYWGILNYILPGSGLMLLTHLVLFWGAVMIFVHSFQGTKFVWFFIGIAFWPQVIGYAPFILKDVGFALTFLLVSSVLTYYTINRARPNSLTVVALVALLFYGAAVKFQALFVLPVILLWLSYVLFGQKLNTKVFVCALGMFVTYYVSVQSFNNQFTTTKNHYWQYVKLFDLAAISLSQNQPLFPAFVIDNPEFSMNNLAKEFRADRVDELVFPKPPILIKGKNPQQRQELLDTWQENVQRYPVDYFAHRYKMLMLMIDHSPLKTLDEIQKNSYPLPLVLTQVLTLASKAGLLKFIINITSFKWHFPLLIIYFLLGLLMLARTNYAVPLFMMNAMGLLLIAILFVFSMASDLRYIYLSMCCLHFSHPFMILCVKEMWQQFTKTRRVVLQTN